MSRRGAPCRVRPGSSGVVGDDSRSHGTESLKPSPAVSARNDPTSDEHALGRARGVHGRRHRPPLLLWPDGLGPGAPRARPRVGAHRRHAPVAGLPGLRRAARRELHGREREDRRPHRRGRRRRGGRRAQLHRAHHRGHALAEPPPGGGLPARQRARPAGRRPRRDPDREGVRLRVERLGLLRHHPVRGLREAVEPVPRGPGGPGPGGGVEREAQRDGLRALEGRRRAGERRGTRRGARGGLAGTSSAPR